MLNKNLKSKSLLIYIDWLYIHLFLYINYFNDNLTHERVIALFEEANKCTPRILVTRLASLLYNRQHSTTRPTIDPTKSLLFPSHFFPSSHCHSILPFFSPHFSFLFLSLVISPQPWYLVSFHYLLRSLIPLPCPFLFLSLSFVTFSSNPLHSFLLISIPSTFLYFSHSIIFFYLPSSLLFTLLIFFHPFLIVQIFIHCSFSFFSSYLNFFTIILFHSCFALSRHHLFRIRIRFNKVGGATCFQYLSHARIGHVVCTL